VRVFEWNNAVNSWLPLGQTEVIQDSLNPDFKKHIKLPFHFEKTQRLKFEVWDQDSPTEWEFLGSTETTLGIIMG
jgi:hypothetical protein